MFGVILRKPVPGPKPRQVEGGRIPGNILIDVCSDYGRYDWKVSEQREQL
jgi:hypothetical protein